MMGKLQARAVDGSWHRLELLSVVNTEMLCWFTGTTDSAMVQSRKQMC